MRNAQKAALMAMFAAMEENRESDQRAPKADPMAPKGRPIEVDPLWLISFGRKGRA